MPPQRSGPPASMATVAAEGAAVLTTYVAWGRKALQRVGYTAQQTSVYSVYFVVKNDSVADLRKIVMAMPKIFFLALY